MTGSRCSHRLLKTLLAACLIAGASTLAAAQYPDKPIKLLVVEKFQHDGVEPVGGTTAEFAALIARELPQWRDLVKTANIKLQ
jgi:tripartite-type tricarboxylate transporter receptor subunit TctC